MKKLLAVVLAMVMCLSLVACGGPDKQPAIDAFNKTSTAFDAVAKVINEDVDAYDEEVVDVMIEMATLLQQHKELLSSDQEITQEALDEMIAWYADVDQWIVDVKDELGIE